jgi:ABC-type nitrate/sulfonate/bicarbonate transport system substrate-binding protein
MKKMQMTLLIAVIWLVAVLTGCAQSSTPTTGANSSGTETTGTTSQPATTPAPAGGLQKVTVVVPRTVEVLDDAHIWSAIKMGYFAEEGLEVKIEQSFGTTDTKMVALKNAQFALPSPNFLFMGIENGLPLKAVFQNDSINIFGMAVKKDSGIKTWADMKGKKVALGDAAWANIINPTLIAAGLDPAKDVEYVVAGENRFQMVQEGKLDILFTWVAEYSQLKGQGFDFEYIDGNEILPYTSNPLVTNADYLKEDPEMVRKFVRALAKGMYFVKMNPEAAADLTLEQFPSIKIPWDGAVGAMMGRVYQGFGLSEADQEKIVKDGIGLADMDKWKLNMDWAVKTGIIKQEIPLENVVTNEFVDTSWDKAKVEADAKNYVFKVKDKYQ